MAQIVYADNAATTKLDIGAYEAMKPFMLEQYANASQPYSLSRGPKKALKQARETIAACINADSEEIFFTSGGSESDNWALKGVMYEFGDHRALVTSQIEHHAVLRAAEAIERMGYPVAYLPPTSDGVVSPEILKSYISNSTKLVSVMYANNEIGSIQPIRELAKIAHQHGAIFHTDAVQAVGHLKIDVKELGVDLLSASAHKFNGPKGVGFLYIKKGTPIHSLVNGGGQESGYRAGTENIANIVGMATALQINCQSLDIVRAHILHLEDVLMKTLMDANLDFIRNGSRDRLPGNISLSFRDASGEMLLHRLDLKGICVSTGSACDSKDTQVSHVLEAIGLPLDYATGTIRISLGKDNTEDDALRISEAIASILAQK